MLIALLVFFLGFLFFFLFINHICDLFDIFFFENIITFVIDE